MRSVVVARGQSEGRLTVKDDSVGGPVLGFRRPPLDGWTVAPIGQSARQVSALCRPQGQQGFTVDCDILAPHSVNTQHRNGAARAVPKRTWKGQHRQCEEGRRQYSPSLEHQLPSWRYTYFTPITMPPRHFQMHGDSTSGHSDLATESETCSRNGLVRDAADWMLGNTVSPFQHY